MRRDEILDHLKEVGRLLDEDGLTGEMYVVGGAAIALLFDERRSTRDVDAVFEPKRAIYDAAARVAAARDLPAGWLNDAVKGFVAGPDAGSAVVLEVPGLRVASASPRILLAMKVLSHRTGEDEDDVRLLAAELRLSSPVEVLSLAADVYGDRLEPAARFFVEQLFQSSTAPPEVRDR
ncbi:MAG: nucleotidyl transferase [Actinobacteria bacterium]|nr:nucleotidyl transferase [Actinomycetota bacterium]